MVTLAPDHDWQLVAPWYRWDPKPQARPGRGTRPAFQKFDRPDFVDGFLKDPQASLRFTSEDVYSRVVPSDPPVPTGFFATRSVTIYAPKGQDAKTMSLVPTGFRKLFLPTHRRYYTVVVEVHCDVPGFPCALAEEPCQIGLVVRRRRFEVPKGERQEVEGFVKAIFDAESRIADLDQTSPLKRSRARKRAERIQKLKDRGAFDEVYRREVADLAEGRRKLQAWREGNDDVELYEGWFPTTVDRVGQWRLVSRRPADVTEAWTPMHRVYAGPGSPDHDAFGRAMYFGVVPTTSFETDERGVPRFDHESLYEIRCFARRHLPPCPRTPDAPDCRGRVYWSEGTEPYRLASPMDLEGTANRPITIQMPDLGELAAQAANLPFGKSSPVRFVQPQMLKPKISGTSLDGGAMEGKAICFFAIPLITIIAYFVLNLFLPIVVFLFNLWFLLSFKFCIPPKIAVTGGAEAKLEVELAALEVEAAAGLSIDGDFEIGVPDPSSSTKVDEETLYGELKASVAAGYENQTGLGADPAGLDTLSMSPLLQLKNQQEDQEALPESENETVGLDLTGSVLETRVTRASVGIA